MLAGQTLPKARQRRHKFEGRAGRECTDRTVDQGIRFVLPQRFPILEFDTWDKSIGIKRGHRNHGENVSVIWIDYHSRGASYRAYCLFGDHLNATVDR